MNQNLNGQNAQQNQVQSANQAFQNQNNSSTSQNQPQQMRILQQNTNTQAQQAQNLNPSYPQQNQQNIVNNVDQQYQQLYNQQSQGMPQPQQQQQQVQQGTAPQQQTTQVQTATGGNKIKLVKVPFENQSSAGNPHNTFLAKQEGQFFINKGLDKEEKDYEETAFNVWDNIVEWYIRTISDELYKLQFIDKLKYYKIKIFWPQEYTLKCQSQQNNQQRPDPITYYLSQFDDFDIEDYFDVIIMTEIQKDQQSSTYRLILHIFLNSFTYLIDEDRDKPNYAKVKGLELFYYKQEKLESKEPFKLTILEELTNLLLKKYIYRKEELKQQVLQLSRIDIQKRLVPIVKEEVKVIFYEFYRDL